jgi:hypothetical protein
MVIKEKKDHKNYHSAEFIHQKQLFFLPWKCRPFIKEYTLYLSGTII